MRSLCVRLIAACALLPAAVAQQSNSKAANASGDWPFYAGNLAGTKYSALAQINTKNVSQLAPAWSYRLAERGAFEITPIVVNGTMYLPAGNKVVALDPETGKEVWTYQLASGQASTRGVAYWPGDGGNPPRILFTAGQSLLVALNALTGKLDPGFGKEGQVDMVVGYNGVPTIYKNTAIVGATVGEVPPVHPAIRGLTMPAPAPSSGSFTPCRSPESRATRPGLTTAGRAARASMCGAGT